MLLYMSKHRCTKAGPIHRYKAGVPRFPGDKALSSGVLLVILNTTLTLILLRLYAFVLWRTPGTFYPC
jgi:hypothetical protein